MSEMFRMKNKYLYIHIETYVKGLKFFRYFQ